MLEGKKILVIDDDLTLLPLIGRLLSQAGGQVYTAADGPGCLRQLAAYRPDLVILDIMLPGMDGWEICCRIRQTSTVPLMILTALGCEDDMIRGLSHCGADDYLVKPFSAGILLARAQALLRRASFPAPPPEPSAYHDSYLTIDPACRRVLVQGQPIRLTAIEYRLLLFMFQHTPQVLDFGRILRHVWGEAYQDSVDYVHKYISQLRQKIEADPKNPCYLLTHHGVGYRLHLFNNSNQF